MRCRDSSYPRSRIFNKKIKKEPLAAGIVAILHIATFLWAGRVWGVLDHFPSARVDRGLDFGNSHDACVVDQVDGVHRISGVDACYSKFSQFLCPGATVAILSPLSVDKLSRVARESRASIVQRDSSVSASNAGEFRANLSSSMPPRLYHSDVSRVSRAFGSGGQISACGCCFRLCALNPEAFHCAVITRSLLDHLQLQARLGPDPCRP